MKLRQLLAAAVMVCGMALAVSAQEIGISNLPEKGKISKLEVGNKDRTAGGTFVISAVPGYLKDQQMVSVPRGNAAVAGIAYTVTIDKPATVYLLVQDRGKVTIPEGWTKSEDKVRWKLGNMNLSDSVYQKNFAAGQVEIPAHDGKDGASFGVPNAVVITALDESAAFITPGKAKIVKMASGNSRALGGDFAIAEAPDFLKDLPMVIINRGKANEQGAAYKFSVSKPVTAYLLVQDRGKATLPEGWTKVDGKVKWTAVKSNFSDSIYEKKFEAGEIEVPGHDGKQGSSFGIPNAVVLKAD